MSRSLLALPLLLAFLAPQARGDELNLQQLIDNAIASKAQRVVIPAGVHRVAPSGRHGAFHLYFNGINDLEVDGTGATLIFTHPDKNGIAFDNVSGLTLRGITVDYDPLPYTQGTVVAIGSNPVSYDVKLDAGYPSDETYFTSRIAAYLYDRNTRLLKHGAFDHYVSKVEQPEPGTFRIQFSNPSAAERSGTEIGDRIIISRRAATAIRFLNSERVNVDQVTIFAAPGMGLHEAHGNGGNRYQFTMTQGPTPAGATEPRLHSANADGFHSSYMKVGPIVENCVIEGQGDDAIAIHDNYSLVTTEGRSNSVVLGPKYELPLEVGDELRVLDNATYALKGTAKVVAIEKQPAPTGEAGAKLAALWRKYQSDVAGKTLYRVTLDRELDFAIGDLASSFQRTGAGFVVRNNRIGPHRARGILIKAPFGVVENNIVDGSNFTGILCGPELNTWLGGDYAAGVTIRNNTVRNTGYAGNVTKSPTSALAGAITVQAKTLDNTFAPNHENAGLVIENNTIENPASAGILVSSAKDVVIRNNTIINPWSVADSTASEGFGVKPGHAIWIDQAKAVTVQGNKVTPSSIAPVGQGPATSEVTTD